MLAVAVGRSRLGQLDTQVPCVQCCGVEKEGETFCSLIPFAPPPHTQFPVLWLAEPQFPHLSLLLQEGWGMADRV